jgi:deoxyribonuclease IV
VEVDMKDLIIGSHVSFNKDTQMVGSIKETLGYNANTFMFYTGAPQNTNRAPIDEELVIKAHQMMKENNIDPGKVIVHAPYIINLGNNEKMDSYRFAIEFLKQEIQRCEALGIYNLVLHPGSSVNLSKEEGIKNIINALNIVLTANQKVKILLETMAGKGSEVGSSLEEIKAIIDGVTLNDKLGVCIDTCHLNDSGYDIGDFDKVLDKIDHIIGLDRVRCVHVNDSKNILGAHKDRHENFGFGELGFDNLLKVIYHPKLSDVPKILETPYVSLDDSNTDRLYPPYKFEIEMIRNKQFNPDLLKDIREFYK